jgi:hypothetical protein
MLLYELSCPVEHKYGGTLTREEHARCTRQTMLDSPKWTPFPVRQPKVDNICGKFVVKLEVKHTRTSPHVSCLNTHPIDPRLRSVCFRTDSPFGRQNEMFHVNGHITVRCTPGLPKSMIFKGARGVASLKILKRDLFLDYKTESKENDNTDMVTPLVHMGVVSSCMGVRLQTSQCCYLENRVLEGAGVMSGGWLTVEGRSPDQCNIVRLSVKDWTGLLLPGVAPVGNDIVITSKGSLVHRLSWAGLDWTEEVERDVLSACQSVAEAISSVLF